MSTVADDPVKQGQLLRDALTKHIRWAKKKRGRIVDFDEGTWAVALEALRPGVSFDYSLVQGVLTTCGFISS